jgi:hypothetical protein
MYNLANPWEMQDFVEDFIFTAAHSELTRYENGEPGLYPSTAKSALSNVGYPLRAAFYCPFEANFLFPVCRTSSVLDAAAL